MWGWRSILDIDEITTIDNIIYNVKLKLKHYFKDANLKELETATDILQLHCHQNMNYIRNNEEIIYLCDHCHNIIAN